MPTSSYKSRKEAFVSNLTGGDISEINHVTLVAPAAVLLWSALQSRKSFFVQRGAAPLLVDMLLNIGAILFATTVYANNPILLNILLVTPAIMLYFTPAAGPSESSSTSKPKRLFRPKIRSLGPKQSAPHSLRGLSRLPVRPFITTYRGAMLIITCLAILAVDFRIFPRRFAKVETWGTSLMDLGVGSFVFSAGLVSARQVLRDRDAASSRSLPHRLAVAIRHSAPLFVLGLVRLYSVKGLDYAEHVTEYGVHWNFFFTLALLAPCVEVFHAATAVVPSYEALALIVAVAYQVVLESTSLKEYILISPRGGSLLSKNREGVFSFIGYFAIFLAGRATGMHAIPRDFSRDPGSARKQLIARLAAWSGIWAVLFFFNSYAAFGYGAGIPVSRRLANMPYVLWTAAFNNAQLLLFCLIETVWFPDVYRATDGVGEQHAISTATSRVMEVYNRHGLAVFLLANLLTGGVNLGMNTLDATTATSLAVLLGYAGCLTGVALVMDKYGIKLKL